MEVVKQARRIENSNEGNKESKGYAQGGTEQSNQSSKRHEVISITKLHGAGAQDPRKRRQAAMERERSQKGTLGSTKMDSILSMIQPDASSPNFRLLRGDSTLSHLLPTQNSKQTHASEATQLNSPTRRLSEYKMIVDGCHCPKFRKMKDL